MRLRQKNSPRSHFGSSHRHPVAIFAQSVPTFEGDIFWHKYFKRGHLRNAVIIWLKPFLASFFTHYGSMHFDSMPFFGQNVSVLVGQPAYTSLDGGASEYAIGNRRNIVKHIMFDKLGC